MVTTCPDVDTSIDRAWTVSSSVILDLIFAVSAPSLSAAPARLAASAVFAPTCAPTSRAFSVSTFPDVPTAGVERAAGPLPGCRRLLPHQPRKNAAAPTRSTRTSTSLSSARNMQPPSYPIAPCTFRARRQCVKIRSMFAPDPTPDPTYQHPAAVE